MSIEDWSNYRSVLISGDKDAWEKFHLKYNLREKLVSAENFTENSFEFFDFYNVIFANCNFINCNFRHSFLTSTKFENCNFFNCNFNNANLKPFYNQENRNFIEPASAQNCVFDKCTMKDMRAYSFILGATTISNCNLMGTIFENLSTFSRNSFVNSNLQNVVFKFPNFSDILWDKVQFNHKTKFHLASFGSSYPIVNDKAEHIVYTKIDFFSNWGRFRFISGLPIFSVSWVALISSLFIVNSLSALNVSEYLTVVNYPIPKPTQIGLVIFDSFLLIVGSTLYKFYCDPDIQNFSESEWVIEHRQPRPLYKSKILQKPIQRLLCFWFMLSGGLLCLYLVAGRFYDAFSNLLNWG